MNAPQTPQQYVDAAWHNCTHTKRLKAAIAALKEGTIERLATMPFNAHAEERLGLTARLGTILLIEADINNIKSE